MADLDRRLADHGGAGAPTTATRQLRGLVLEAMRYGRDELAKARSGYDGPVRVAFAATPAELLAVVPVAAAIRADPESMGERAWLLTAAAVGALVEVAGPPAPAGAADLRLRAADLEGFLSLRYPLPGSEPDTAELCVMAFADQVAGIDRLRASGAAFPPAALKDDGNAREPIGAAHPLRVAEVVARLGGRPADPGSIDSLEDAVLAVLDAGARGGTGFRPHEEPDPALRVARRILQRLNGMGKWGGYHTDFAHLPRGFAGNERQLAIAVGEALLQAGLLDEKPSVGQRHVFLNPRRAGEIHRLIETGDAPPDLGLPK